MRTMDKPNTVFKLVQAFYYFASKLVFFVFVFLFCFFSKILAAFPLLVKIN